jgi:hypothetical protein
LSRSNAGQAGSVVERHADLRIYGEAFTIVPADAHPAVDARPADARPATDARPAARKRRSS